eukprot:TRINITY_DN11617_c0_g1_i2.p1 TRINITY_DN11617_c0_g1~~TRINITY_DN11617_c0_g1_i2.p1  ORF type:complete len:256 (+),score=85.57 TRINITY_DN11617_c0_g1_i2:45-770(+)
MPPKKAKPAEDPEKEDKAVATSGLKQKIITSEAEAAKVVLNYLSKENRPFNVVTVFTNLQGLVGKALVQKVMDQLTAEGKLKMKENGKTNIYYLSQDNVQILTSTEMDEIDAKIRVKSEEVSAFQGEIKELQDSIKEVQNQLSEEELTAQIAAMEAEAQEKQQRLDRLGDPANLITDAEKKQIGKQYDQLVTLYRKRKRMCTEVMEGMQDQTNKKPKQIREMLGVEGDDDVGFDLNTVLGS